MSLDTSDDHWSAWVRDCEARNAPYVLVTVLGAKGSTPRDSGTKMVVHENGFDGTIGGGTLEFSALDAARELLTQGTSAQSVISYPLGEKLGQCCGGSTSLLYECFVPQRDPLYLFGAGHVGRALAPLLASLPLHVHWIDTREEEFPDPVPGNITTLSNEAPVEVIKTASSGAYFLIMTHQHPLDFAILEAALAREDSAYIGVIGSQSKARRFRMRLAHRGVSDALIDSIRCPIGFSSVPGKRPAEIAVSVAAEIIAHYHARHRARQNTAGATGRSLREAFPTHLLDTQPGEVTENSHADNVASKNPMQALRANSDD